MQLHLVFFLSLRIQLDPIRSNWIEVVQILRSLPFLTTNSRIQPLSSGSLKIVDPFMFLVDFFPILHNVSDHGRMSSLLDRSTKRDRPHGIDGIDFASFN